MTSASGAHYSALLPVPDFPRKDVNSRSTLGYTAFGEDFAFRGTPIPAKPEDAAFAGKFWELAGRLLAAGKLKTAPLRLNDGGEGFEGILYGLEEFRQGKVSGEKLVYKIPA